MTVDKTFMNRRGSNERIGKRVPREPLLCQLLLDTTGFLLSVKVFIAN